MNALMAALLLVSTSQAVSAKAPAPPAADHPVVVLATSMGTIQITLDRAKAPVSVENFLTYVRARHYDGTIFHRVIPGFMAQGGGFDSQMRQKAVRAPIKNEASNGLGNRRGTIAMARTMDPDSATAQFFINVVDNGYRLDPNPGSAGYTVFGEVTAGMDVVDRIVAVPTRTRGMYENVPVAPVIIKTASVLGEAPRPRAPKGPTPRKKTP